MVLVASPSSIYPCQGELLTVAARHACSYSFEDTCESAYRKYGRPYLIAVMALLVSCRSLSSLEDCVAAEFGHDLNTTAVTPPLR